MSAHLSEEEQLEALKRWWKDNGKSTVAMIAVLLAVFFGWNQYQDHQVNKANDGSALFERFVEVSTAFDESKSEGQQAKIKGLADEIAKQSASSLYNDFARMYLAKMAVEEGDIDTAKSILNEVLSSTEDESIKELVRLRYARLVAQSGEVEKALGLLKANVSGSFKPAYEEAKGDILLAANRLDEAHTAYKSAHQGLAADQFMRKNMIQMKIDHTAKAQPSVENSATENESGDA